MKFTAKIKKVKKETHDVLTFVLDKPDDFTFTAGQYCLLTFDKRKEQRPFTFASSPTFDKIEITFKIMRDFTVDMADLKKGDELTIDGPKGETYNFDESVKEDIVFLSGGSGVTPHISALRYAIDKNLENKFTMIFSNRKKKDIIFRDELQKLNEKENVQVVNTLTKEEPGDWGGGGEETGYIDEDMIEKYVDDKKDKLWYICGPPPMMDAMEKLLKQMDIPDDKVHVESWQIKGKHDKNG